MAEMKRSDKLERIVAAYSLFAAAIPDVPDEWAARLRTMAAGVAPTVARLSQPGSGARSSEIAAGLEQGLRETPDLIACVAPQWRLGVAEAFCHAIAATYPDLYATDRKRLERVVARGKIKSEAELYLIRHHADAAESDPNAREFAERLNGLLAAYELRA